MAKFLTLWETDLTRVPESPEDQMALYTRLQEMVKKDLESGTTKDFGIFMSGFEGYSIDEGTEEEVALSAIKYSPYIKCKVHPILSLSQLEKITKILSQA